MTDMTEVIKTIKQANKKINPLQTQFLQKLSDGIPTIQITDDDLTLLVSHLITYLDSPQRKDITQQQLIIDILGKIGQRIQNDNTVKTILSILNRKFVHQNLRENIVQALQLVSLNPVLKKNRQLSTSLLQILFHISEDEYDIKLKEKAAAILNNINFAFLGIDGIDRLFQIGRKTTSSNVRRSVTNVIKNAFDFHGPQLKHLYKKGFQILDDSPSSSFSRTARRMIDTATAHLPNLPKFHAGDDLGEERGNQPQGILIVLFFLLLL
jgi:hypothetical protein